MSVACVIALPARMKCPALSMAAACRVLRCLLLLSLGGGLAGTAAAQDRDAARMSVSASAKLGEATLGRPQRTLPAGEEFNFTLGERGVLQVVIIGRCAPINDRASALDYTIEMEEWTAAGTEVRRASQTVRTENGAAYRVGGLRDKKGRELIVELTVTRP